MLKNGRRLFVLAVLIGLLCVTAHAQFDKTPWPRTQNVPPVDLLDMNGQRWNADTLKGRLVVLNFWATWCGPCKEEMPSLQALHAYDPLKPVVIGVNVKETASTVRRFVQAQQLDFPVVLDPQGELARQWGVRIYPTTILIDPQGQPRWRVAGEVDWVGVPARGWLQSLQKLRPSRPVSAGR